MSADIEQALEYTSVRVTTYKFLVYVITTRPDVEFTKEICSLSLEWFSSYSKNSKETGASILRQFVKDNKHNNLEDLSTKLAVEWTRTFRGIKPGYGPPPARASAYRSYNVLALVKKYNEAGLELAHSQFDPDYLGIQLAFLYELVAQELNHLQHGDLQKAIVLQSEQRDFIKNYLDWVSDFCYQAEKWLELPLYKGVLLLMQEFLNEDLLWLDI